MKYNPYMSVSEKKKVAKTLLYSGDFKDVPNSFLDSAILYGFNKKIPKSNWLMPKEYGNGTRYGVAFRLRNPNEKASKGKEIDIVKDSEMYCTIDLPNVVTIAPMYKNPIVTDYTKYGDAIFKTKDLDLLTILYGEREKTKDFKPSVIKDKVTGFQWMLLQSNDADYIAESQSISPSDFKRELAKKVDFHSFLWNIEYNSPVKNDDEIFDSVERKLLLNSIDNDKMVKVDPNKMVTECKIVPSKSKGKRYGHELNFNINGKKYDRGDVERALYYIKHFVFEKDDPTIGRHLERITPKNIEFYLKGDDLIIKSENKNYKDLYFKIPPKSDKNVTNETDIEKYKKSYEILSKPHEKVRYANEHDEKAEGYHGDYTIYDQLILEKDGDRITPKKLRIISDDKNHAYLYWQFSLADIIDNNENNTFITKNGDLRVGDLIVPKMDIRKYTKYTPFRPTKSMNKSSMKLPKSKNTCLLEPDDTAIRGQKLKGYYNSDYTSVYVPKDVMESELVKKGSKNGMKEVKLDDFYLKSEDAVCRSDKNGSEACYSIHHFAPITYISENCRKDHDVKYYLFGKGKTPMFFAKIDDKGLIIGPKRN